MSAPETKALPPAPERTTTRIELSLAKSCRISSAASHISSEVALCRSGLLKIIDPIGPSLRESILSVAMATHSSLKLQQPDEGLQISKINPEEHTGYDE